MRTKAKKVVLIAGLPGSGKTWLAKELLKKWPVATLYDDFTDAELAALQVKAPRYLIITDPHLCIEDSRNAAHSWMQKLGYKEIEWIFFENDPETCLANVRYRDDGRPVEGLVKSLSRYYTIPENAVPRKVWDSRKAIYYTCNGFGF